MRTLMPFELVGPFSHLIVVPAYVNGTGPFSFALDTGGAHSTISTALGERLGVEAQESKESFGVGSAIPLTRNSSTFPRRLHSHLPLEIINACQDSVLHQ